MAESEVNLSSYLLHRIGLVTDELEWPISTSKAEAWTKKHTSEGGCGEQRALETQAEQASGAWRVRDTITSIVGCPVPVEMDKAKKDGTAAGDCGEVASKTALIDIDSDILSPLTPTQYDLEMFVAEEEEEDSEDEDDEDSTSSEYLDYDSSDDSYPRPLDIKRVKRAFHAAAFSIVRGNKRALAAAFADADETNEFDGKGGNLSKNFSKTESYEAPFIRAMEAIRIARMKSLDVASGKTVPPFLKKNNTIPWFHMPAATIPGSVGTIGSTVPTTKADEDNPKEEDGKGSNFPKKRTDLGKDQSSCLEGDQSCNKRIKLDQGKDDVDAVNLMDGSVESPTKFKVTVKEENVYDADNRTPESPDTTSTKPESKNPNVAKVSKTKTACIAGGPCSSLSPAANIDNRCTAAKSILCATAGVVFQGLTPDFMESDDNYTTETYKPANPDPDSITSSDHKRMNIDGIESSVIETSQGFVGSRSTSVRNEASTQTKSKWQIDLLEIPQNENCGIDDCNEEMLSAENDLHSNHGASKETKQDDIVTNDTAKSLNLKVNMGAVLVQAKTLGNRVIDHTKGAANRSDRRREFRMDCALSRVGKGLVHVNHDGTGNSGNHAATNSSQKCAGGSISAVLVAPAHSLPLVVPNPFAMFDSDDEETKMYGTDGEGDDTEEELSYENRTLNESLTSGPSPQNVDDPEWTNICLPRFLAILRKGAGHAVFHDMDWDNRHHRVASLFYNLATPQPPSGDLGSNERYLDWNSLRMAGRSSPSSIRGFPNYGPHLIVTSSGHDFNRFASVFGQLGHRLRVFCREGNENSYKFSRDSFPTNPEDVVLRIIPYHGSKERRRRLRKHFGTLSPTPDSPFCYLGGLPDSPYHVILTTFSAFVEDYSHFCQIPFQAVVLDDGMSWLGCASYDPNGKFGKAWDSGVWSNSDGGAGLGGVGACSWDFSKDDGGIDDEKKKSVNGGLSTSKKDSAGSSGDVSGNVKLLIGLTARHRILLASSMHAELRGQVYKAPVQGLLSFLMPQFTDAVRDEWERSRIHNCDLSMNYMRKLIVRSVVVYCGDPTIRRECDSFTLALKSMNGELMSSQMLKSESSFDEDSGSLVVPSTKIAQPRRFATSWFKPSSSAGNELGSISLEPILSAVRIYSSAGFVCEELVTASSLTTSGAGGQVAGPAAYRSAIRCGRSFGSEQGLRQHIAALHAPPGTWLCRSCGGDCFTSQARTHHERTCGITEGGVNGSLGGTIPTVGHGVGSTRGPKKKEVKNLAAAVIKSDKDADGSIRVPGFKGVWVKPNGKHFIKIDGESILDENFASNEDGDTLMVFDTAEEAAKKFDEIITGRGKAHDTEMNFKTDGSRIVYEDSATGASAGRGVEMLGGGANSVVPALSVINIKDLPPNVKPLLRDPKQTSRTGGNSKRYVYAYRGVCRQARKGHDRWQSQISFNGTNHYLGTFDSEWDAAAVYAWAHLILYGEEATRKAQREGEEAAAAYEQEKKDIAEGKIPPPAAKPPKKKKKPGASKKVVKSLQSKPKKKTTNKKEPATLDTSVDATVHVDSQDQAGKKRAPTSVKEWSTLKTECAMMLSSGTKGTSKANILGTRKEIADSSEKNLLTNIPDRANNGSKLFLPRMSSGFSRSLPSCLPLNRFAPSSLPRDAAMLIGLTGSKFSWDVDKFAASSFDAVANYAAVNLSTLLTEFGEGGCNERFRAVMLSQSCTFGRASKESKKIYSSILINDTLGMSLGDLDCDIGGPEYSCSEMAARIEHSPTKFGKYQIVACNDDDIVTLNGRRIIASTGPFPIRNRDICSIGARVFVFIRKYKPK